MRLNVGILGDSRGWESLLEQEGVPHSVVSDAMLPENYSVIVAGDQVDDRESEMLRQYLTLGGAVLCSAKVYAQIRRSTYGQEYVEYFLPDADSIFANIGILDVRTMCRLAWNANELRTDERLLAGHVGSYENGHVVALPFDAPTLLHDERAETKSFYSPEPRLPFERVSAVSKGNLRKLVARSLEVLHHRRGLPYVHLWYYPNDAQTVFSFRVDTDYSGPGEIDDLYNLAQECRIPVTWFVDVKSQELFLSLFKRMVGHEIAIHCYEHQTYGDYASNEANIRQAKKIFEASELKARGFAAPFGIWNEQLGRAIEDAGFGYSSEFSYDYDNLPSYPSLRNHRSTTLQVPVHPISIGSLKRQGYSSAQMKRYFSFVVNQKISSRDSLLLYHHPKDGNPEVLRDVFESVKGAKVPLVTMADYASWWKKRLAVQPRAAMKRSTLWLEYENNPSDVWLHATKSDGSEAYIPLKREINVEMLEWKAQPKPLPFPLDYARAREFNYRIPLTKTVDYVARLLKPPK